MNISLHELSGLILEDSSELSRYSSEEIRDEIMKNKDQKPYFPDMEEVCA